MMEYNFDFQTNRRAFIDFIKRNMVQSNSEGQVRRINRLEVLDIKMESKYVDNDTLRKEFSIIADDLLFIVIFTS